MAKNRTLSKAVKRQEKATSSESQLPGQIIITERQASTFGVGRCAANANELERPYVSLKYFDSSYECFSDWTKADLTGFTDLLRKMGHMTWVQIQATGGRSGTKTGLGCTRLPRNILPASSTSNLSEDLLFMELRVNSKARIHGFRMNDAFFLLCLDKDHKICS